MWGINQSRFMIIRSNPRGRWFEGQPHHFRTLGVSISQGNCLCLASAPLCGGYICPPTGFLHLLQFPHTVHRPACLETRKDKRSRDWKAESMNPGHKCICMSKSKKREWMNHTWKRRRFFSLQRWRVAEQCGSVWMWGGLASVRAFYYSCKQYSSSVRVSRRPPRTFLQPNETFL